MANKPRHPCIAGLLTFLSRGLGHVYAGSPKRGLILFTIEQCLLLALGVSTLAYTPDIFSLLVAVVIGIGFTAFCVVDAVKIAKSNRHRYELAKYNRWFVYLGYYVILSLGVSTGLSEGVKANLVKAYKLPSRSMEPTLLPGDHVLVDHSAKATSPQKGQIIIFEYPENPTKDFIKRVVAVGGDTVEIKDKQLYVNGKAVKEEYIEHKEIETIPASQNPRDNFGPIEVPGNSYFVMGDNRDITYDSRFFGAVAKDKVKGIVKSIYWSWDREKFAVRWDRIGIHVR